jgi:predicted short-subunit dehydrogenase-like oxidoreductase (DUF2520 family)
MTAKHKRRQREVSQRRRTRKLNIAIIGAGRLGIALGLALSASDHAIKIAVARSVRSARRAATLLKTHGTAVGSKRLGRMHAADRKLIGQSDLVLITTPDDSIAKVAGDLAGISELRQQTGRVKSRPARVVLHTSGALTSEVLLPLRELGFATASMHPLMSISGETNQSKPFSGIHFSLEGETAAIRSGKRLVRDIGGNSFVIGRQTKPLYHAAAVMVSPNVTALIDIAIEMLRHCGIAASRAREILLPLMRSTVENLVNQNPRLALTGTFKRGDVDTVKVHLAAIASERLTDALRAYATLGNRSLTISGVPKSRRRTIEALIAQATARYEANDRIPTKRNPHASKSPRRN